jgi:electron transfer flavoprotein alpha/beta subunit
MKAKMAAKNKPVDKVAISELEIDIDLQTNLVSEENWSLPPKRGECKFIDAADVDAAVGELLSLLKNEAKVL